MNLQRRLSYQRDGLEYCYQDNGNNAIDAYVISRVQSYRQLMKQKEEEKQRSEVMKMMSDKIEKGMEKALNKLFQR